MKYFDKGSFNNFREKNTKPKLYLYRTIRRTPIKQNVLQFLGGMESHTVLPSLLTFLPKTIMLIFCGSSFCTPCLELRFTSKIYLKFSIVFRIIGCHWINKKEEQGNPQLLNKSPLDKRFLFVLLYTKGIYYIQGNKNKKRLSIECMKHFWGFFWFWFTFKIHD